jgi:asparagine synthase (glutamine-hydrolysing)
MEYSFRIPHQYKYHHGEKKYILKDILYDYVPKEMLDRPKNGFGVPLGKWLRSYLREELQRVSEKDYIEKQGLFCYDVIQELIAKVERSDRKPYPKILWAYYIFQLWYAENFD